MSCMSNSQSRHMGALYADNHQAFHKIEDAEVECLLIVIN